MTDEGYIPDNSPVKKIAPYIIAATALVCYILTIFSLFNGVDVIYPNLYYFPIILTALFYPRKGTAFAILMSIILLFTTFVITNGDISLIVENLIRSVVFVGMAAIVSKISFILREDNLKYKNLMDSSGAASAVLDNDGKIVHTNQAFQNITGYNLKELKKKNWISIFKDESSGKALHIYQNALTGHDDEVKNKDLTVRSKAGSEYSVLATIRYIPELEITLITLVDITEKKKTDKIIKVQKERYQRLFQQSTDGIFIHNTEGRIFNANAEALRQTGMTIHEIKNTNLISIIPKEFHEKYRQAIQTVIPEGKPFKFEGWMEPANAPRIDLDIRSVMTDEKTKVIQTITRDITLRKKNEKALAIASKKLNLLSSITRHDILNHIMVARINLEFAKEDAQNESVKSFLDKSVLAIDTIQHQIEFSRDYQDMGGSPPRWYNLNKIVGNCISSQNLPGDIKVRTDIGMAEIFADRMLEKVVCNLIGNTIMHGGENTSKISISMVEEENCYNLIYEDDGKGISEKDKTNIFRPGFGRNQGFGLYLVSEILSITEASITENGTEGKGARFEIRFLKSDVRNFNPQESR